MEEIVEDLDRWGEEMVVVGSDSGPEKVIGGLTFKVTLRETSRED